MKAYRLCLLAMILSAWAVAAPAVAKEGVQATVHTEIPASSEAGTQLEVQWTLADEEDGSPFSACSVFIRLLGLGGEETEAFAPRCSDSNGRYTAVVTIPSGGVAAVAVGVAGTMTRNGVSRRSDWLMELANDPIM